MANETLFPRTGNGVGYFIDTEVTENGNYPVQGKGIKAYVDTKSVELFEFDEESAYAGGYILTHGKQYKECYLPITVNSDVSTEYGDYFCNWTSGVSDADVQLSLPEELNITTATIPFEAYVIWQINGSPLNPAPALPIIHTEVRVANADKKACIGIVCAASTQISSAKGTLVIRYK